LIFLAAKDIFPQFLIIAGLTTIKTGDIMDAMKTIGVAEASRQLGVCPVTMHVWDKNGFLVATRNEFNHRRYTQQQIDDIKKNNHMKIVKPRRNPPPK